MEYRKAQINDLSELLNIRYEMLCEINIIKTEDLSDEFKECIRNYFINGEQSTFIALNDKIIIGCATICYINVMPTFDHQSGKRAHIMNVYVKEGYRNKGNGYKLLDLMVNEAKNNGITHISLDATEKGRQLYKKYGFINSEEGMEFEIR